MLRNSPSGDLFGWSHNVGMGWRPDLITKDQVLILTTSGGIRQDDGQPIALGYHTGHWRSIWLRGRQLLSLKKTTGFLLQLIALTPVMEELKAPQA